jgi:hypothetical protein
MSDSSSLVSTGDRYPKITIILLIIVVVWSLSGLGIWWLMPTWETRGAFGDMFGAANALFSGVALAGLVYAILLQRQELGLQRRELETTRHELRRSADAQEYEHRLLQVDFLMRLNDRFAQDRRNYEQACRVLRKYNEQPKRMPIQEWQAVVDALERCHASAKFLYQLARLVSADIVEANLVYTLHADNLRDHPDALLSFLKDWCGTGLDQAANYDASTVLKVARPIRELLEVMRALSLDRDKPDQQIEHIQRIEEEINANPQAFDVSTANRYVSIDAEGEKF